MVDTGMRVAFHSIWKSVMAGVTVTVPAAWTEPGSVGPRIPWTVACDGTDLRLTVGPVAFDRSLASEALATFHQLRETAGPAGAGACLPADATGARLFLSHPLSHAISGTLREVLAEPLAELLGDEPAATLITDVASDGIVLELARPLSPELAYRVMPVLAGLGAAVALEAPDGHLPRGGVPQLMDAARTLLAGKPSRAVPARKAVPDGEFGALHVVPFRSNARPVDEAERPGTGCSEAVAVISSGTARDADLLWILFELTESDDARSAGLPVEVRISGSYLPGPDSPLLGPVAVPGLTGATVAARRVARGHHPRPTLEPAPFAAGGGARYVAEIDVQRELLPGAAGSGWAWSDADAQLRNATPDGADPFTFAHMFKQRLKIDVESYAAGLPVARRSTEVDVFDIARFGSLYDRMINRLVAADTQAQAAARRQSRIYHAYHPWYPVLAIGLAKAKLYMRAIEEDVYWQRRNLADPGWLMRVGLYLEFLTCLGIIEAVKAEHPNLLTTAERRCFESSPAFEQIRRRIDPNAWRRVWEQRAIVFAASPVTAAGPVDFRNLIQKETANLAFLDAHHADLKHAVELAGPNLQSGQQTWHHVYRAAERAVMSSSQQVFPEFRQLGGPHQHFVLWHERGKFPTALGLLPPWLTGAVGDRDGVYPTAARRYRESMNEVAEWARQRGLMAYDGTECIPASASLIEAQLHGENESYSAMEAGDGFAHQPSVTGMRLSPVTSREADTVVKILRSVELFSSLSVSEVWRLADQCERRRFQPGAMILVQGDPSSSLTVIERGSVEVLIHLEDGTLLTVGAMGKGDTFGEYSLLTGQPAGATVRAAEETVVHRIPKSALQPIIEARPELVVDLCVVLSDRRAKNQSKTDDYLFASNGPPDAGAMGRLVTRARSFLLS